MQNNHVDRKHFIENLLLKPADHVKPAVTEPKQENQYTDKLGRELLGHISIVHTMSCSLILRMDLISHTYYYSS